MLNDNPYLWPSMRGQAQDHMAQHLDAWWPSLKGPAHVYDVANQWDGIQPKETPISTVTWLGLAIGDHIDGIVKRLDVAAMTAMPIAPHTYGLRPYVGRDSLVIDFDRAELTGHGDFCGLVTFEAGLTVTYHFESYDEEAELIIDQSIEEVAAHSANSWVEGLGFVRYTAVTAQHRPGFAETSPHPHWLRIAGTVTSAEYG